ncbi:hypothetical protein ACO0K0_18825 [Undibacterium sp. SXout11W]|uniref:hypothetical protein n=1 Tax=Undibacterium sp. SXout11W TaxID=3413050 RepID=UPI003BF09299
MMNLMHVKILPLYRLSNLCTLMFLGFFCASVSAQTTPSSTSSVAEAPVTVPIHLDLDKVNDKVIKQAAKEISKDTSQTNVKPNVFTTMHDDFEKSLGNYESRKKISGSVEAGVGVGNLPSVRGYQSENVTCGYAATSINDDISKNTQVSVYAQTSSCKTK